MERMTDEEYVAAQGARCPFCGSEEITGGPVEIEDDGAVQEVGCAACGKHWDDLYKLIGYTTDEDGDDEGAADEKD